ncbi:MAG: hypothetical protein ACPG32_10790 [Akkermansiaceae bacterium]
MAKINLTEEYKEFLKLCLKHKVKFLIIGGYAVVHYTRPCFTGDLNIWLERSSGNALRAAAVLKDFGFKGNDIDPEPFTKKAQIIRMGFEPFRLELFTSIPGVEFKKSYPNRVLVDLGGFEVPFIGVDDLKVNKATCGRDKDLLDLKALSDL